MIDCKSWVVTRGDSMISTFYLHSIVSKRVRCDIDGVSFMNKLGTSWAYLRPVRTNPYFYTWWKNSFLNNRYHIVRYRWLPKQRLTIIMESLLVNQMEIQKISKSDNTGAYRCWVGSEWIFEVFPCCWIIGCRFTIFKWFQKMIKFML